MLYLQRSLIFFVILHQVGGYRVLVFFPCPGKSHAILGEGFVRHLAKAGHDVTYVTPIPIVNPVPNVRQIDVSSNFELMDYKKGVDIKTIMDKKSEFDLSQMFLLMHNIAKWGITHKNVQKLLLDPKEEFDLVILEWLYTEIFAGVPAVFNCPYIWSSSMEPHHMVLALIDDVPNPAYFPDQSSALTPPLTFKQRVSELWYMLYIRYIRWKLSSMEQKTYEEAYGPAFAKRGRPMPSLEEVKYNSSLMFGNSHASTGLALRLPQNYISIAGYHIKEDVPALPDNLRKIMENARHGVIYFSLGTIAQGKSMPQELKRGLLKIFSELKEVVLWKLEEKLTNLPVNVHILQWAPQASILAHPNTVLFITHGGLLSTIEALHYGVPIIGIPIFADQMANIAQAVNNGYAKHVQIGYDMPLKLKIAIDDVLSNPKYRQRVEEMSLVYHDRLVPPGQELVHWVEHVVKTQGAPHLRSIALLVPWYQKLYVDMIILIIIGVLLIVKLFKILMIQMVRQNTSRTKKEN